MFMTCWRGIAELASGFALTMTQVENSSENLMMMSKLNTIYGILFVTLRSAN
jgi:hypothetical protein